MLSQLFHDVAPKTAENFRALCTGILNFNLFADYSFLLSKVAFSSIPVFYYPSKQVFGHVYVLSIHATIVYAFGCKLVFTCNLSTYWTVHLSSPTFLWLIVFRRERYQFKYWKIASLQGFFLPSNYERLHREGMLFYLVLNLNFLTVFLYMPFHCGWTWLSSGFPLPLFML